MTESGTAVFGDAVRLVADALGIELDDVVCEAEYARTTRDLDLGTWSIPEGHVAGVSISWQGRRDDRTVIALNARWRKGEHLDPDWSIEHGYVCLLYTSQGDQRLGHPLTLVGEHHPAVHTRVRDGGIAGQHHHQQRRP